MTLAPTAWMRSSPAVTPRRSPAGEKSRTNTSYSALRATQDVSGAVMRTAACWASAGDPAANESQAARTP